MVIISREFNKEMDDYLERIRQRQKRSGEINKWSIPIKKKKEEPKIKKKEKIPEEIEEENIIMEYSDKELSWWDKLFSRKKRTDPEIIEAEEELEEITDEIEELEEERETIVQKFLKLLRRKETTAEEELEEFEEEEPTLDPEVKDLLKRLHQWLEKLPNRDLRAFKVSEDFELYKKVLEKYGLIKKNE